MRLTLANPVDAWNYAVGMPIAMHPDGPPRWWKSHRWWARAWRWLTKRNWRVADVDHAEGAITLRRAR